MPVPTNHPQTHRPAEGLRHRSLSWLAAIALVWSAAAVGQEVPVPVETVEQPWAGDYYGYNNGSSLPMPNESPSAFFSRRFAAWTTSEEEVIESGPVEAGVEEPHNPDQLASFSDSLELRDSYVDDYGNVGYASEGGCPDCGQCGPSDRKPGVFQKLDISATHIPQGDATDLGVTDVEAYAVFGLPFPTEATPLLITPGFAVHTFDGPNTPDLPGTVYDAYVQLRWLGKINDCWGFDLAVSPGVYSDFEEVDGDAWRITGRAIASYQATPTRMYVFGVAYLDREDVPVIPAGGVIYTPCDDVRWELIAPRPRYMRRYYADCCQEDWWYVAGEFGGGQWSIQRASGAADIVTMRDYRALLGIERKLDGGAGRRIEVGYVFGRELEYQSATPDVQFDSAFLIRGGWTY